MRNCEGSMALRHQPVAAVMVPSAGCLEMVGRVITVGSKRASVIVMKWIGSDCYLRLVKADARRVGVAQQQLLEAVPRIAANIDQPVKRAPPVVLDHCRHACTFVN